MVEERTLDDLTDEEFEDYERNPEKYGDVVDNTNESILDMMFPDGQDDD